MALHNLGGGVIMMDQSNWAIAKEISKLNKQNFKMHHY
jgi:hypothetical protein